MRGMTVLHPKKAPFALIDINRSHSCPSSTSISVPEVTPALFTRMSNLAHFATAAATAFFQSSSSVTSSLAKNAPSPNERAKAAPSLSNISAMQTLAPSWTNLFAVAAPKPDAAPEISAVLPVSRISFFLCPIHWERASKDVQYVKTHSCRFHLTDSTQPSARSDWVYRRQDIPAPLDHPNYRCP